MKLILAKTSGFCFGVKNAIIKVIYALNNNKKISILGDLIHNPDIIKILKIRGIKTIEDISENLEKSPVVVRTHGIEIDKLKNLYEQQFDVINLTCPKVSRIHSIIKKY